MQAQILALQRQAEAKVNQLEPRKLMMYRELVQRANALQVGRCVRKGRRQGSEAADAVVVT